MEIHGVLSHLVAKICRVEKQNKQILVHLVRLCRKGEEHSEEKNGEHEEREDKRISWEMERRGRSRRRSGAEDSGDAGRRGGKPLLEVSCFDCIYYGNTYIGTKKRRRKKEEEKKKKKKIAKVGDNNGQATTQFNF